MVRVLSNEDVESLLSMDACIEVLESAYRDLGADAAVNRPRTDVYTPTSRPDTYYAFKSMEGMLPTAGVVALRVNSDVIRWTEGTATPRKDKVPAAPGGRWVGLVFLFSVETGQLLAIFPDGVIQRMRVGATSAIASRRLARAEARVMGLFGAGWQAGGHLLAMHAVHRLELVKVYSPTEATRGRFAAEMAEVTGLEVRAVDSPQAVVEGSDLVVCATNSLAPVLDADWLGPGAYLSCVKYAELGDRPLARSQLVFVNTHHAAPENYIVGRGPERIVAHDPLADLGMGRMKPSIPEPDWNRFPELAALVAGRVAGRSDDRQIACFVNVIGLGVQFAAVGARVLELANARGVGQELPSDWFTESVHP